MKRNDLKWRWKRWRDIPIWQDHVSSGFFVFLATSLGDWKEKEPFKFTGFHYKAAVFDQDEELIPEIARLQLKTLDEKEIWIPDFEAKKIIKEGKKWNFI